MNLKQAACGALMLTGASIGLRTCTHEPTAEEQAHAEKAAAVEKAAQFLYTLGLSHPSECLLRGPGYLEPFLERFNYAGAINAVDQLQDDIDELRAHTEQIANLRRALVEAHEAAEKAYPRSRAAEKDYPRSSD